MRTFSLPKLLFAVVALAGAAGYAAQTNARADTPRCTAVGCTEALDLAVAEPGSSVQLVQCEGAVRTERRYVLEPGGWTLQMYKSGMSDPCPAPPAR